MSVVVLKNHPAGMHWDYEKNSRSIDDVSDTASFECYFTCDKGHTVKKRVYHITDSYNSHGEYRCDICNLAINKYPEIRQYWSDENTFPIDKYSYGSGVKAYWVCENNHHVKRSFQSVCNCLRKGSGFGCVECKKLAFKRPDLIDEWSDKNEKHINNYSYSSRYKAWWKCPNGHNDYKAMIYNRFYSHDGCPVCVTSKGEKLTEAILRDVFKVEYIKQKAFSDCKHIKRLRFDFYLPEYNTCIEYDGEQHFRPVEVFGGEEGHLKTKKRDEIKNKYCKDNNIGLIRIPYNQIDNIEEILLKELIRKGGN